MTTIGFCTHFTETDEWAFDYALSLARSHGWQLNICHWLHSPYLLRREMVSDDLFQPGNIQPVTPQLLNRLEFQLREYYETRLGDFTDVAFKLCEGQYQVELVRCFRKNLLDLVVMGYQPGAGLVESGELSLEEYGQKIPFPLIVIGRQGPGSFLLNGKAAEWLDRLQLPQGSWSIVEKAPEQ